MLARLYRFVPPETGTRDTGYGYAIFTIDPKRLTYSFCSTALSYIDDFVKRAIKHFVGGQTDSTRWGSVLPPTPLLARFLPLIEKKRRRAQQTAPHIQHEYDTSYFPPH